MPEKDPLQTINPTLLSHVVLVLELPSKGKAGEMSSGIFPSVAVAGGGGGHVGSLPETSRKSLPLKGSVSWKDRTVSNGSRATCMKTWNPIKNKKFEALSYLPPLTSDSIVKEVEYMVSKGWIPCLEFDEVGHVHRTNSRMPGYYDGRYWTLWKLPMFDCTNADRVLQEVEECKKAYPNAYIRLLAFDSKSHCQSMSFVIQKPTEA